MPSVSPQLSFLLRGSLLLVVMLAVWWLILLNPLLFLLRVSADLPLQLLGGPSADPIVLENSGDWTCRVPVHAVREGVKIRSIEFTIPRSDVVLFTFSLPVYWAIILASPAIRKAARPLLWGTLLVAGVQVLALVTFVVIIAHTVAAQMQTGDSEIGRWGREFGNYLVVNVVPATAPLLVALFLHRELRSQIFSWQPR